MTQTSSDLVTPPSSACTWYFLLAARDRLRWFGFPGTAVPESPDQFILFQQSGVLGSLVACTTTSSVDFFTVAQFSCSSHIGLGCILHYCQAHQLATWAACIPLRRASTIALVWSAAGAAWRLWFGGIRWRWHITLRYSPPNVPQVKEKLRRQLFNLFTWA